MGKRRSKNATAQGANAVKRQLKERIKDLHYPYGQLTLNFPVSWEELTAVSKK